MPLPPAPAGAPARARAAALRPALLLGLGALWVALGLWPAWRSVQASRSARDYASYHYAVQEALDGGDPYDTAALSARARAEGTRDEVHPYFYPPPFLLLLGWAWPLSLERSAALWFWANVGVYGLTLGALRRWLRLSPLAVGVLGFTLTPALDSLKMGQANLPVLLAVVLGLWAGSGGAIALAAMWKMSPALLLGPWLARGRGRPVAVAVAGAVVLSLVSLPLVGLDAQLRFYTEILPGFGSGDYHGLKVPLTLPGNHSLPDLLRQAFPGSGPHRLAAAPRLLGQALSLVAFAGLCALARRLPRGDALGEALVMGAVLCLALITPVYTYEHHLSLLLLPGATLAAALEGGRVRGRGWWAAALLAWAGGAWWLSWLRGAQELAPALRWPLQESKFAAVVLLGLLNALAAAAPLRRPPAAG